jgi:hypothetical protein
MANCNNTLPMIAEKGITEARHQVGGGYRAARWEKKHSHRKERRVNKELLTRDVEDYEPDVIRGNAWNVS